MGGPHAWSSSIKRRPSSAASSTRKGTRLSKTADKSSSKKDVSSLLKATLAEEEKKQLATWLDKKHKELDVKLKKLGVPSPSRLDASARASEKAEPVSAGEDDIMMVLGKRLGKGTRPLHTHRMEFLLDEDACGGGGFDDGADSCLSPSRSPCDTSRSLGSPDRRGLDDEDRAGPLAARLATAAQRHHYSAKQVLELFFPLWDDRTHTEDTKALLPLDQVVDVLAVDLGLKLSKAEQRALEREADRDTKGARVDVGRLLKEAGLWPDEEEGQNRGEGGEWAKAAERGRTHWAAAARREVGPKPDRERAKQRLQQRRHDAAVHIQRMVRGRQARTHAATLKFNKMTSRHQVLRGERARPSSSTRHREGGLKKDDPLLKTKEEADNHRPRSSKAYRSVWAEKDEEERGEGRGDRKGQKQAGRVDDAMDEDLDALLDRAFGDAFQEFSRRTTGGEELDQLLVDGRGASVVELMHEPFCTPPRGEAEKEIGKEKGKGQEKEKGKEKGKEKEKAADPRQLFDGEEWANEPVPYDDALLSCVRKGGEGAFYRLAAVVRGMQMGQGEDVAAFLPYNRIRAALCEAGYELEDAECERFLLGVACDRSGRLDVTEVLQAIADLLHEIAFADGNKVPPRGQPDEMPDTASGGAAPGGGPARTCGRRVWCGRMGRRRVRWAGQRVGPCDRCWGPPRGRCWCS